MQAPLEAPARPRAATAAGDAHQRLRAMILDDALPPGTQLLEAELAVLLGMSRTPVREAMIRLEQEGLVSITPRHGMRVLPISATDMREIYEVLTSLEPTAAELLARRSLPAAALAPLHQACAAMEAALAAEDRRAWAAADEAFHRGLVELCGNGRLAAMAMQVWDQSHRARMFTLNMRPLPAASTAEHRAIMQAIAAGDGDAAREMFHRHRRRGGSELIALIERSGLAWV
ncbi:GntR family transcriptional regulator [Falsiroseomonas selenitidurans]|uniref:GntR family transcriptional regulator n=1 Tax=Falsiroseomonas selenitidurans TaxID=2716335 RepID=A0ABX1E218_9PROT|nr:GntR family transcriptional regulator [Falsiroseomonas selenitidurans]NKC31205.1 GntR family transcriptional regulator [Falsiroseomonas selenitidurans]